MSLAQAILESNWGESLLASKYYNLYGVKGSAAEPNVVLVKRRIEKRQTTTNGIESI